MGADRADRRPAGRRCDADRVDAAPIPPLPGDLVAILATIGPAGPVAVPVSAIHRRDARSVLVALSRRRATVARLRDDPRAALSLNGAGFSLCVEGDARLAADPLAGADSMVAFLIEARHAWDARGPVTEIDAGIRWRWTEPGAGDRHARVLAALAELAGASTPTERTA